MQLSDDYAAYYGWTGDGNALPVDPLNTSASHIIVGGAAMASMGNSPTDGNWEISGSNYVSQSFTAGATCRIASVDLRLWVGSQYSDTGSTFFEVLQQLDSMGEGSPTVRIELYDANLDGTPKFSQGAITAKEMTSASLTTSPAWYNFVFDTNALITNGNKYAIVVKALPNLWTNLWDKIEWARSSAHGYAGGNAATSSNGGSSWTAQTGYDNCFNINVVADASSSLWVQGADERTIKITPDNLDLIALYNNQTSLRYRHAPYLLAWDLIATYGRKESAYHNDTISDAEALWLVGCVWMMENAVPMTEYTIDVVDLYEIDPSKYSFEMIELGSTMMVIDEILGINVATSIISIDKTLDTPGTIKVELSTSYPDYTDAYFNIKRQQQVQQRYQRATTSKQVVQLVGNADASNPNYFTFEVTDQPSSVGNVTLSWYTSNFQSSTSDVTDNTTAVNDTEAAHTHVMWQFDNATSYAFYVNYLNDLTPYTYMGAYLLKDALGNKLWGDDNHTVQVGLTGCAVAGADPITGTVISGGSGTAHTHDQVTHDHDVVTGITQGAQSNSIDVDIDGNSVQVASDGGKLNIREYLLKDTAGDVRRGWHTIVFYPDDQVRITGAVEIQEVN